VTRSRGLAARLAAAVLVTAAAGLAGVATAPPASAATCSTGSGVSVVVDFGGAGGVQTACVADGAGRSAASLFVSAGFSLTPVQNEPGFVCRINGFPSDQVESCVDTPPDDAYWGLWWSDGTSGSWSYSNYGVSSLKVPDGAYVGFAWQTGSKAPPGAAPALHASTPTPAATPSATASSGTNDHGGGKGGKGGKSGHGPVGGHGTPSPSASTPGSAAPTTAASGSASAEPSASPSASPTKAGGRGGKHRTPSAAPAPSGSVVPAPTTATEAPAAAPDARSDVQASAEGAALPAWVVPLVILVLGAGASVAYVKRRRHRPSP
jgi:hypothetical protein